MIDLDGFRHNIGIILVNKRNKLFLGRRIQQNAWQFPQGGINKGESEIEALYRELHEEIGLKSKDVQIIGKTKKWLKYLLPDSLIRKKQQPLCLGQKQKWFMLLLTSSDNVISLEESDYPEFNAWRWVDYWEPVKEVIYFKQEVYKIALTELHEHLPKI